MFWSGQVFSSSEISRKVHLHLLDWIRSKTSHSFNIWIPYFTSHWNIKRKLLVPIILLTLLILLTLHYIPRSVIYESSVFHQNNVTNIARVTRDPLWSEVLFIQEVSGVYTSPFLDTDELKMTSWSRKVSGAFERQVRGRGHCVVFLGNTLYSHSASLHPGV